MLGSFKVPPGSLPVFPITFMMIMVPLYDHVIIPHVRKWTKTETGVSHLQRAGIGLCFSILAMVVAALVETKRKKVADEHGLDNGRLPISFLWIAFQYLFLGSADLFVLAGLMEFAFSEAPIRMRSLATSFSWASLALGYYLSGVIVSLVNSVTGSGKHHHPWLSGENLNHYRLDRFYWLMSVLSVLNLVNYVFWTNRYKYKSISANN
ncbi:NRT1/ PTR family 4.6-like protein [Tanacetum coccineum]